MVWLWLAIISSSEPTQSAAGNKIRSSWKALLPSSEPLPLTKKAVCRQRTWRECLWINIIARTGIKKTEIGWGSRTTSRFAEFGMWAGKAHRFSWIGHNIGFVQEWFKIDSFNAFSLNGLWSAKLRKMRMAFVDIFKPSDQIVSYW